MCSVSASPMDLALKLDSSSPAVASRAPKSPPRPASSSISLRVPRVASDAPRFSAEEEDLRAAAARRMRGGAVAVPFAPRALDADAARARGATAGVATVAVNMTGRVARPVRVTSDVARWDVAPSELNLTATSG